MEWLRCRLGDIILLEYGKPLPARDRDSSGSFEVAGSNGPDGKHTKAIVKAPGVVVGRKGSAGKVWWYEKSFWPIDTTYYVVPRRALDIRWAYYLLTALHLERLASATGVPGLNRNDAYRLEVRLPPLSEQRHIVEILDQANRLRRLRADADAKTARIIPALFIKLFGDPSANRMRWPTSQLGDLAQHMTSGSRGWAKYTGRGPALFVRTQDIADGEVSAHLLSIDPPDGAEADRTRLLEGDVVVTITGVVGKAAVVRESSKDLFVSQHVALIRLHRDLISPEYFAAYANLPLGDVPVLARFQYGQTKPGLGFRELRTARVPLPPLDLQKAFAEGVSAVSRLRDSIRVSQHDFESLWDRVLHEAFHGSLTASWREAHVKELHQETQQVMAELAEA
jgi:type I restriction enzyme S subunit